MDQNTPDFTAWTHELYGPEVVAKLPATQAYRRAVFNLDANGRPTFKNPIHVAVDKYGLPVAVQGAEPDQHEQLELRWDAALIDYPLPEHPTARSKPPWSKYWITELLHGSIRQDTLREQGVLQWKAAGFTPELYSLIHELLPRTVYRLRGLREDLATQNWFGARLAELGITLDEQGCVERLRLSPAQWADFPGLLHRVRPGEAIELIIKVGKPGSR